MFLFVIKVHEELLNMHVSPNKDKDNLYSSYIQLIDKLYKNGVSCLSKYNQTVQLRKFLNLLFNLSIVIFRSSNRTNEKMA